MTSIQSTASELPHVPETRTPSVRSAAVWAMAGQYLSFAIQFATSVVISRLFLNPAEVGLFSIALAAALLVAVLQDFGLSRYISGLASLDREEIARCSTVALLFSFVVTGLVAASAMPLSKFYRQPDLAPIVLIISGSYLFLPLSVVPMALLGRAMQFRGHFLVNVGSAATQAIVAIVLAANGWSAFALAWATLAAGLARGLIAQALQPVLPCRPHVGGLRPVLGFGARTSLLYITGALGTRTPDLIVGKFLGLGAVGLYSRAASLSDQFRTLISGAIGSVFYPAFARIRDRGAPLGPAYLRVCAGYSAVVWPGMAGLALASEPLVRILYGDAWNGVAPLLAMVALAEILLISLPLVSDLPILMGRLNRLLVYNVADTALSIALLALGCLWGPEGAAASRLAYGVGWLCLYFGFMRGLIGFSLRQMASIYVRSLVVTIAAIAPLAVSLATWTTAESISFGALASLSALGVPCWLGALIITRHPALHDIRALAATLPIGRLRRHFSETPA